MSSKKLPYAIIFCDGACSGNPGPGGWGAIVVSTDGKVRELGGGDSQTTNNQMEMIGLIEALRTLHGTSDPIEVYTDSSYVLRGITEWVHGWKRRGWKTSEGKDVANIPIWKELLAMSQKFEKDQIRWGYVPGHKGFEGNERVDEIAVAFSKGVRPTLYSGPLVGYDTDVLHLPDDTSIPEMKFNAPGEKKVAYSYLSSLGGVVYRHADWKSCEARVKGQSGARFKKAMSAEEESQILAEWGADPSKVK